MSNEKLERCGFCGSFFRGVEYLTEDEVKSISEEELSKVSLGYCPNANYEDGSGRQQVTRDMAIDAGDPSLEGQWI